MQAHNKILFVGFLANVISLAITFAIAYAVMSLGASAYKSHHDMCGKTLKIEKYINAELFCEEKN